jgi:hypothetical protein
MLSFGIVFWNLKDMKLGRIWGFHSGDYEEYRLLGYDAV